MKLLIAAAALSFSAAPAFASCSFMLTSNVLMNTLSSAPETGMGFQHVELEMTDGTFVSPVFVTSGRYLQYGGSQSFAEIDIKDISKVFDRAGKQIWP